MQKYFWRSYKKFKIMQLETLQLCLIILFAKTNENVLPERREILNTKHSQQIPENEVESQKSHDNKIYYNNPRQSQYNYNIKIYGNSDGIGSNQHEEDINSKSYSQHQTVVSGTKVSDFYTGKFQHPPVTDNVDTQAQKILNLNQNLFLKQWTETKTKNINTCHHIQDSSKNICPEGFNMTVNLNCVLVEKQKFPPSCPYPNFLSYNNIDGFIDKFFKYYSVWIQAFRNLSSGFPNFQWMESNYYYTYESYLDGLIIKPSNLSYNNCIIRKNGTFYPVSCSEEHIVVCVYSFYDLIIRSARESCYTENFNGVCIRAHYDIRQGTCFCKTSNKYQPPKNRFCSKLAEPTLPFQTQLLITVGNSNFSSGKCWIGLKKEMNYYKWSSTSKNVGYTKWAKPYNCKYSEGAIQFGQYNFGGWILQKDRTLDCAICELKTPLEIPRFDLYRSYENFYTILLYLERYHDFSTYKPNYAIHCVSDENEDGFKTPTHVMEQKKTKTYTIMKVLPSRLLPSHYWCEIFHYSSSNVIKSDVVVSHWMFEYVHEFSIHIKVYATTAFFIQQEHLQICEQIKKQINGSYEIESVRPMRAYFDEQSHYLTMIAHASITRTLKTATQERLNLLNLLTNMSIITDVFSSQICILTTSVTQNGLLLEWPETRIGATAIPSNRLCLDEEHDMLPVRRKCEGDFLNGGRWREPIGSCAANTTYSETTEELFGFLNQSLSADTLIDNLLRISEKYSENRSIDVHLLSQNLEKLDFLSEKINGVDYSKIVSNIMYFDKQTLREAQFLLNSTDKLLSSLDSFLNNEPYTSIVTPKLTTQIIDLNDSNVIGTALFKETPNANNFYEYKFSLLFKNTSLRTITNNEQLEMAVILPRERLNNHNTTKLIVTAFYNDHLFNDQESNHDIAKIISVSTSGVTGRLKHPISIFFKNPKGHYKNKKCTSWQYGINLLSVSVHGEWKIDGYSKIHGLVELCEFYHMTHFGHLLQIEIKDHELPLKIITIVGSALSLIGIIPIYITAIIFKNWRKRPGNIILFNFCTAITLQVILTFMLYAVTKDGIFCKTVGALIHYSILSEFCWMLVIAILQYKRYVAVFKPRETNILKKSLFVGWGIALFPIFIAICTPTTNYAFSEELKFCYITGIYYYVGLLLPIVIILSINGIIFGIIIRNISRSNVTVCVERSRDYKREILLAFLLFFILGLYWLFGVLGILGAGDWVTYMFCITATLRGLVLFMYFIFGNKETRLLWKTRFAYWQYNMLLLKMRRNI